MSSTVSFSDNIAAFNNFIDTMGQVMNKTKNISYVGNKNLTTIAGITNCEKLGVLGKPVALKEDLNSKANTNHNHQLGDIMMSYEEEEDYEEETMNEEDQLVYETKTRTITKTKPLSELLDDKADSSHTHSISDIADLQIALDAKASTSHNHDLSYASINHNHDSSYAALNHNHDLSYAALNHTHNLEDVEFTFEEEEDYEEETINEEEELVYETKTRTITKTKDLSELLDEKANVNHNHDSSYATINHTHNYANSSHTHTTSDITNWTNATSNFSTITGNNTFTGTNTFNAKLWAKDINAQNIEWLQNIDFWSPDDMKIDFKKMLSTYNDRARIIYTTSGDYNNTLSLDINKGHAIHARVYSDGGGLGNQDYFTTLIHDITLLNGAGETIIEKLNVSTVVNIYTSLISQLVSGLVYGTSTEFKFGKADNTDECGELTYYRANPDSTSYIHLYLRGNQGLRIYKEHMETDFSGSSGESLDLYRPNLSGGSENYMIIGKNNTMDGSKYKNRLEIGYHHDADNNTNNDNYAYICVENRNLKIYNNKVQATVPLYAGGIYSTDYLYVDNFNLGATTNKQMVRISAPNLSTGSSIEMTIGKGMDNTYADDIKNQGAIGYHHTSNNNTDNLNYIYLYKEGEKLKVYNDNITCETALNVNGYTTINSTTTGYHTPLRVFAPNLGSGNIAFICIGKAFENTDKTAYIGYTYNTDSNERALKLGLGSNWDAITINYWGVNVYNTMFNTRHYNAHQASFYRTDMSVGGETYISIGKNNSTPHNRASFGYSMAAGENVIGNYAFIYMNGYCLKVYETNVDIDRTCNINGTTTISSSTTTNHSPLKIVAPGLTNNTAATIALGKSADGTTNCGYLNYNYSTTASDCSVGLGLGGTYNTVKIFYNRVDIYKNTNITGRVIAKNPNSDPHYLTSTVTPTSTGQEICVLKVYADYLNTYNDCYASMYFGYSISLSAQFRYYYNSTAANRYTEIRHDGDAKIKLKPSEVEMVKKTRITTSSHNEFPLEVNVPALSADSWEKIGISDGNRIAVMGLSKNSDNSYHAYYKLNGQSAEFRVFDDKFVFRNSPVYMTNLAQDTKNAILDVVYPVGCTTFGWHPNRGTWSSSATVTGKNGNFNVNFTVYNRTA